MKTDILNLISETVLAVLAIVFLSVLVIFNNDGFTLSAFLLFAAFAFVLALDKKYTRHALLLSGILQLRTLVLDSHHHARWQVGDTNCCGILLDILTTRPRGTKYVNF